MKDDVAAPPKPPPRRRSSSTNDAVVHRWHYHPSSPPCPRPTLVPHARGPNMRPRHHHLLGLLIVHHDAILLHVHLRPTAGIEDRIVDVRRNHHYRQVGIGRGTRCESDRDTVQRTDDGPRRRHAHTANRVRTRDAQGHQSRYAS
jgi:hypothetical protein